MSCHHVSNYDVNACYAIRGTHEKRQNEVIQFAEIFVQQNLD